MDKTEKDLPQRWYKMRWKILGIEFAPVCTSLRRRLQILSVTLFVLSLTLDIFVVFPSFIYLIFTKYWMVAVVWGSWTFYDRNTSLRGGRKFKWLRNSKFWHYQRDYFPIRLVKTADLPSNKNYLFGVYPHGIASFASILNFQSNANNFDSLYPGIDPYLALLNIHFRVPFSRDLWLALGAIDSSKESILHCLNGEPGKSCVIMPGGMKESLFSTPGDCVCVLKSRKGFVKVALETGTSLVPVFSFGENDLYEQINGPWVLKFQEAVRKFIGVPPCLIKGRGIFQYTLGVLPQRKPVTTIIGAPIFLPKLQNPSQQMIDEYHQKYVEALVSLFDEHKEKYHVKGKDAELKIV